MATPMNTQKLKQHSEAFIHCDSCGRFLTDKKEWIPLKEIEKEDLSEILKSRMGLNEKKIAKMYCEDCLEYYREEIFKILNFKK